MNYINGITLTALKVEETSPNLGSNTLHVISTHQPQVTRVNPTHEASVHGWLYSSFQLSFFFSFLSLGGPWTENYTF